MADDGGTDESIQGGSRPSEESVRRHRLLQRLSADDIHLLRLVARGLPLTAIAREVDVSERTLRRRLTRICDVLGVHTVMEAVVLATRCGAI